MEYDLQKLAEQLSSQYPPTIGFAADRSEIHKQVVGILSLASSQGDLNGIARQIVEHVGLDRLLPECYAKFQPLVTESMVFLLQQLSLERLARKITEQLLLAPEASRGRRLCALISDMPSLQKLGQVICRSPGLAPGFKKALIKLEDHLDTVRYSDLLTTIEREIEASSGRYRFKVQQEILAEASVCAVVAADLSEKGKKAPQRVVLKVVKPRVRQNLAPELKLLGRLALFLDRNKIRWGLSDFKFKGTLDQVQWLLENEINLTLEQDNLLTAGRYYPKSAGLAIPEPLPCSTPSMTVMTRVQGRKITDVDGLDAAQRHQLAMALAETCILRPVKNLGDVTIFHGDPHAGNIAYILEKSKPRIIFYDWGMMGRLNRLERFSLAVMAIGVMAGSTPIVLLAADIISGGGIFFDAGKKADIHSAVQRILDGRQTWTKNVLTDINALIGEFTCHGVVFPTNLLMFEKAMITLKGVFADIDPEFYDGSLIWTALGIQLRDLCRPGYYWELYRELWTVGRYGAVGLFKFQRLLIKLAVTLCN